MLLPTGHDNFKSLIKSKLTFVDKSLFIKEILDDNSAPAAVITRPRRFGKTLNLSMLHYFVANKECAGEDTGYLFDNLNISKIDNGAYLKYQGQFPSIFISFKEVNAESFDQTYNDLCELIIATFNMHNYLEQSEKISKANRELFTIIVSRKANESQIKNSLKTLTACLAEHHGSNPWLFIDEYDAPIQAGYLHNYYDKITNLMRGMLGAALKTNEYLERSIITGILRVAKESLFSGLNNLCVYSILHKKYSEHFGFTEAEVASLLKMSGLNNKEEVRQWYNGYVFGGTTVYNPWSIARYINEKGVLKAYWINTSDNKLIKDLLLESNIEFKKQFELLLQDKTISKFIDEDMVFENLKSNTQSAWSLLVMSGYLKVVTTTTNELGDLVYECAIPNKEVRDLYCEIIKYWLCDNRGIELYQSFLMHLLVGNIDKFAECLGQLLMRVVSVHDVARSPEMFYHGLWLGLLAGLDPKRYEYNSNKESGLGRYDITIIPRDISKSAIILELKSITTPNLTEKALNTLLNREAQTALKQINQKQYTAEAKQRGFAKIIKLGIAFCGKEFRLAFEND